MIRRTTYLTTLVLLIGFQLRAQVTLITQTTPTTEALWGISFANDTTGYACGNAGVILKTTDAGANWNLLTSGTTNNLNDIKVIPGTNGLEVMVVGDNNTALKTLDGGATWTTQTIPFQSGSFVFGIQIISPTTYVACGGDYASMSGAILKTTDGGTNWVKTAVPGTFFLDKIHMRDDENGMAVGTTFDDGCINKTTDGGTNFPIVNTSGGVVTNLWYFDSTTYIAIGEGGQILKTTDGGENWTDYADNTTDLHGIWFINDLHGFVCGGSFNSIIMETFNGGLSWSQIDYIVDPLHAMCIYGDKIYMPGSNGIIVQGTIPAVAAIPELTYSFNVSPNPASEYLVFSTDQLLPFSEMTIELIDANGKLVKRSELNGKSTEIKVSNIESGIYFYNIKHHDKQLDAGKIVLAND